MQGSDDLPVLSRLSQAAAITSWNTWWKKYSKRQPAEEQDFLLKTSILDRLCGPLCDAVANRTGSALLLDR